MGFLSLKIFFIIANSADPDEMPPSVAFHLCLHCLPKYPFTGIQHEKRVKAETCEQRDSIQMTHVLLSH